MNTELQMAKIVIEMEELNALIDDSMANYPFEERAELIMSKFKDLTAGFVFLNKESERIRLCNRAKMDSGEDDRSLLNDLNHEISFGENLNDLKTKAAKISEKIRKYKEKDLA